MADLRSSQARLALSGGVDMYKWRNNSSGELQDSLILFPAGDRSAEGIDAGHAEFLTNKTGERVVFMGRLTTEQLTELAQGVN